MTTNISTRNKYCEKKSKQKRDKKSKDKSSSRGLRSDGDVEELNGRDPLVVRMGKTLENMKDAFIVAHLHDRKYADEKWQLRLKEIEEEKAQEEKEATGGATDGRKSTDVPDDANVAEPSKVEKESDTKEKTPKAETSASAESSEAPAASTASSSKGKDSTPPAPGSAEDAGAPMAGDPKASSTSAEAKADVKAEANGAAERKTEKSAAMDEDKKEEGAKKKEGAESANGGDMESGDAATAPEAPKSDSSSSSSSSLSSSSSASSSSSSSSASSSAGSDAAAAEELDQEVNEPLKGGLTIKASPNPKDETEDVDPQLESEFFDTRQQFLNLCQGNHYQFDTSRRAKHTSMMALYHIHNPNIPKFVSQCSSCGLDIISGYRYDCDQCPEYHLCPKCVQHFSNLRQNPHHHRLKKTQVQGEGALTEEQKRQRARSIQLHMQLLAHAAICRNPKCPSANCEKMKVCGVLWFNSISTIVATQLTSMISFCTRRAVYRTFSRMVRNVKPKCRAGVTYADASGRCFKFTRVSAESRIAKCRNAGN